jgi:hypothetical protein
MLTLGVFGWGFLSMSADSRVVLLLLRLLLLHNCCTSAGAASCNRV